VVTGVRNQGFVELREGVRAGEPLIADGLNKITAGQAVQVGGKRPPGGQAGRAAGAGPSSNGRPSA
jgi:membrane fusion protein (multidrug efflux system)